MCTTASAKLPLAVGADAEQVHEHVLGGDACRTVAGDPLQIVLKLGVVLGNAGEELAPQIVAVVSFNAGVRYLGAESRGVVGPNGSGLEID